MALLVALVGGVLGPKIFMEFLTFKPKIAAPERERYLTDLHALRREVNTLSEELIGTKEEAEIGNSLLVA